MLRYHKIKGELSCSCRSCLNRKYGLKLQPKDCIYEHYPYVCPKCGEVKNIVKNIKLLRRLFV